MSSIADKYRTLQQIGTISSRPVPEDAPQSANEDFGLKAVAGYMLREKEVPISAFAELGHLGALLPEDFICIGKHRALSEMRPERLIFLDTETTGLAGGTGTYAFLVGLAFWRETHVQVKQFFMADPSQESAMLQAVRDAMQAGDGLVTFNGKSYDVPLLQSRMILNRIAWKSADFLHLDLMHACRRLWRPFAADGRLQSMEQTVLALYRENDIAGELIPALYFDSVRQRNPSALKPVFQHNVLDLISMARLLVKAGQVFAKPTAETLFHRIGVARTYEHLGRFEQACAVCMPQESMTADEKYQILLRHARNLKRLQRYDEAAHVLTKLVNASSRFLVEPYIELIKLYEHRLLDLSMALQFTQRALQNIAVVSELDDRADWEIIQQAMAHRMGRIQSKLKRMNEKGTQSD